MRLIRQIATEVQADGHRFLVVLVDGIYGGPRFGVVLRDLGIEVLELDSVMAFGDNTLHLPDQLHWSPAGNAVVADAVGRILRP